MSPTAPSISRDIFVKLNRSTSHSSNWSWSVHWHVLYILCKWMKIYRVKHYVPALVLLRQLGLTAIMANDTQPFLRTLTAVIADRRNNRRPAILPDISFYFPTGTSVFYEKFPFGRFPDLRASLGSKHRHPSPGRTAVAGRLIPVTLTWWSWQGQKPCVLVIWRVWWAGETDISKNTGLTNFVKS